VKRETPESSRGEEKEWEEPKLGAAEDTDALRRELEELREQVDSKDARPHCLPDPDDDGDEEVWIQCRAKSVIVPYAKSQGRAHHPDIPAEGEDLGASMREILTEWRNRLDASRTSVEKPGEELAVQALIRRERRRAPGLRGGTTQDEPRWRWEERNQGKGIPAAAGPTPRPDGRP
jgi:hypothetical protein